MNGNQGAVYIDTCVLLPWLKNEEKSDSVALLLEQADRKEIVLMTSVITLTEILSSTLPHDKYSGFEKFLQNLFTLIAIDMKVARLAHDIRNFYQIKNQNKIKTPDALHLATAILYRADEFHTFDNDLLKLASEVAGYKLKISKPVATRPQFDLRKPPNVN